VTPARRRRAGLVPRPVVVLGTGGNCVDIIDAIDEINAAGTGAYDCLGFLDDNQSLWGTRLCGLEVLGPLAMATELPSDACFVAGLGSVRNFTRRDAIIAKTGLPLERFETIVHPSASVSRMSRLGPGTVILQLVTVASSVVTGSQVVVLPNTVLSHDSVIGDYTLIGGGVCVSGGVRVGQNCYLGTGSAIRENVRVGERALVGMGSVVLHDVAADSVVVGNPARFLRSTRDEPTPIARGAASA
jgi:sugar O-acyltransferase (sialic acid O-acetyltransferase NeuD family)